MTETEPSAWCTDDRHGSPCPQPCEACQDAGCDPAARVLADSAIEAARAAGWSEAYIAEAMRAAP